MDSSDQKFCPVEYYFIIKFGVLGFVVIRLAPSWVSNEHLVLLWFYCWGAQTLFWSIKPIISSDSHSHSQHSLVIGEPGIKYLLKNQTYKYIVLYN